MPKGAIHPNVDNWRRVSKLNVVGRMRKLVDQQMYSPFQHHLLTLKRRFSAVSTNFRVLFSVLSSGSCSEQLSTRSVCSVLQTWSKKFKPLKKNHEGLVGIASDIKKSLQKLRLGRILLVNSGNIGKSYRRHDEIGTPLCITIDFETLEDGSVTIRDRDTMNQSRVKIEELSKYLETLIIK